MEPDIIVGPSLSLFHSLSYLPRLWSPDTWVVVVAQEERDSSAPSLPWPLPLLSEQDTVFQVDLLREVHLAGDGGENQSLLAAVRERKLNFAV